MKYTSSIIIIICKLVMVSSSLRYHGLGGRYDAIIDVDVVGICIWSGWMFVI